jgi:hypothetical protein
VSENCEFGKYGPAEMEELYVSALDQSVMGGPKLEEFRAAMKWLNGSTVSDACRKDFADSLPAEGLLSDDLYLEQDNGRTIVKTLIEP